MLFRSIRFRLTLWYAVTLAVIMTASGFFWLSHLGRILEDKVDERLLLIAEDIVAYHNYSRATLPEYSSCDGLKSFIRSHNWGSYVQILNEQGKIDCFSDNLGTFHLPLGKAALLHAGRGEPYYETESSLPVAQLRILTFPVLEKSRIFELVQVADSLEPVANTLAHFRQKLLTFSPLLLLLLSCCGWFLAGRTLAPIVRLNRSMQKITVENLNQLLPVGKSGDELALLAETFNSMLTRLAESVGRIKQFSADASHEMRTPLAILKGETEVALRWAKDPEELRSTLESNLEEIDRMGHIIEDLLSLAKSEVGELHLNLTEFSLSDLLQDLYLQGNILGESKGIAATLELRVAMEIHIRGDQLQIHRMLLNLLSNAVKYTPDHGRVHISMEICGEDAKIAIADTGIGMAPKHLAQIFERFYRVDEARNREAGGAGLGLAIVKAIVEAHSGRIEVSSEPKQGSTFTVFLPLAGPTPSHK